MGTYSNRNLPIGVKPDTPSLMGRLRRWYLRSKLETLEARATRCKRELLQLGTHESAHRAEVHKVCREMLDSVESHMAQQSHKFHTYLGKTQKQIRAVRAKL